MVVTKSLFLFTVLIVSSAKTSVADNLPLFASDEVIDLVFEVPLNTIIKRAQDIPVVEGVMRFTDDDGKAVSLHIEMNTRGKSRLAYCHFPPLKINLQRDETDGTIFVGQNKLKLVTRCRRGSSFERYVLQEYAIYGAFNVVAERSFRVRKLQVTYRDTEGKRKDEVQAGYFIETDNEVAARYGMVEINVGKVKPAQLDPAHTNKLELFQFLIANTDWSTLSPADGEDCCHNSKLIAKPAAQHGWIVLPYDFDQAGLIFTRYAMPSANLGLRSVRQRLYRGRCINIHELDKTITIFNDRRPAIEAELLPDDLQGRYRKTAAKFIDEFYEIINDPEKRKKNIIDKCVGHA